MKRNSTFLISDAMNYFSSLLTTSQISQTLMVIKKRSFCNKF